MPTCSSALRAPPCTHYTVSESSLRVEEKQFGKVVFSYCDCYSPHRSHGCGVRRAAGSASVYRVQ
eukprot:5482536-Prymnesium_polylepis.1